MQFGTPQEVREAISDELADAAECAREQVLLIPMDAIVILEGEIPASHVKVVVDEHGRVQQVAHYTEA